MTVDIPMNGLYMQAEHVPAAGYLGYIKVVLCCDGVRLSEETRGINQFQDANRARAGAALDVFKSYVMYSALGAVVKKLQ